MCHSTYAVYCFFKEISCFYLKDWKQSKTTPWHSWRRVVHVFGLSSCTLNSIETHLYTVFPDLVYLTYVVVLIAMYVILWSWLNMCNVSSNTNHISISLPYNIAVERLVHRQWWGGKTWKKHNVLSSFVFLLQSFNLCTPKKNKYVKVILDLQKK